MLPFIYSFFLIERISRERGERERESLGAKDETERDAGGKNLG